MTLVYSDKVLTNQALFINKVIQISQKLGIDPNWLMQVMYFESAGTFSPSKVNPYTGAVGLIQFMPDTARALGTTMASLKAMSNVAQLDYVYKYLLPYKSKIHTFIDLYFAVFFPAAIDKPVNWVFQSKNLSRSLIARQNPAFDVNKDKQITVSEVQDTMFNRIPASYQTFFKKKALS